MTNELKTRWIAALRSGRYQQGYGFLRKNDRGVDVFCCLGVLCDVLAVPVVTSGDFYLYDNEAMGLSRATKTQCGLTVRQENTLIHMNDTEKKPFFEIADWIDENIPT